MQIKKISEISKELKTYTGIVLHPNGDKEYLLNGKRHRTDGPAIEWSDGDNNLWYYQNEYIDVDSQEEFETWLKVAAFE